MANSNNFLLPSCSRRTPNDKKTDDKQEIIEGKQNSLPSKCSWLIEIHVDDG